jgi:hypothetical protein
VGQFIELISRFDGWIFRGQEDANWSLDSSLSRYLAQYIPDAREWPIREERALRIFRRKAHNFLDDPTVLDDDLRCLALMQHHGARTRMLDFTKSPFVAAFFAFCDAKNDCAVFALDTPKLWRRSPIQDPDLTRSTIDPRAKGNFAKYFLPNAHELLWVGEPRQMDRRLVAQSGTFVVPGVLNKTLDQIIDNYQTGSGFIKKIILSQSMRFEAMQALYRMNITHSTLFPDLDGLARSMAYELEMTWAGYKND